MIVFVVNDTIIALTFTRFNVWMFVALKLTFLQKEKRTRFTRSRWDVRVQVCVCVCVCVLHRRKCDRGFAPRVCEYTLSVRSIPQHLPSLVMVYSAIASSSHPLALSNNCVRKLDFRTEQTLLAYIYSVYNDSDDFHPDIRPSLQTKTGASWRHMRSTQTFYRLLLCVCLLLSHTYATYDVRIELYCEREAMHVTNISGFYRITQMLFNML